MARVTWTCSQVDCRAGTSGRTSLLNSCISTTPTIATGTVTVPTTLTPQRFSATRVSAAKVQTKLRSISYRLANGGWPASYQRCATAAVLAMRPAHVDKGANLVDGLAPVAAE